MAVSQARRRIPNAFADHTKASSWKKVREGLKREHGKGKVAGTAFTNAWGGGGVEGQGLHCDVPPGVRHTWVRSLSFYPSLVRSARRSRGAFALHPAQIPKTPQTWPLSPSQRATTI
jgi:hypothetical protein